MPLRDLVYRCPLCGTEGTDGSGDGAACAGCGGRFGRCPGGRVDVRPAAGPARRLAPAQLLARMAELGGAETDPPEGRLEADVVRTLLSSARPVRRRGALLGWVERAEDPTPGRLWVDARCLGFTAEDGETEQWPLAQLRSLQVASKSLQVKPSRYLPCMSFRLLAASPLRWELLLRRRIRRARTPARVVEFQPRIVSEGDVADARARVPVPRSAPRRPAPTGTRDPLPLYGPARRLVQGLLRLLGPVRVDGRHHIPSRGPCLLVANHQSILDALVVQGACPRRVRAMAKSTQFTRAGWSRLLGALGAFPVRRFEPDPQAVRTTLRLLAAGEVVAVYPEGERSWDGHLDPFRRGTLRLLLAAGVPVVPVAVLGTYAVWPRWSGRPRRGGMRVRFGPPLALPVLAHRAGREAALPELDDRLRRAFAALGVPGSPDRSAGAGAEDGIGAGAADSPPAAHGSAS